GLMERHAEEDVLEAPGEQEVELREDAVERGEDERSGEQADHDDDVVEVAATTRREGRGRVEQHKQRHQHRRTAGATHNIEAVTYQPTPPLSGAAQPLLSVRCQSDCYLSVGETLFVEHVCSSERDHARLRLG